MKPTHQLRALPVTAVAIVGAIHHKTDHTLRDVAVLSLEGGDKHEIQVAGKHEADYLKGALNGGFLVTDEEGDTFPIPRDEFKKRFEPIRPDVPQVQFTEEHSDVADFLRELANQIDQGGEVPEQACIVYGTYGGMMRVASVGSMSGVEDIGLLALAQSIMVEHIRPNGNVKEDDE